MRADLAVNKGDHVAEVMWDISKAFDRVPREILAKRALSLGYPSSILKLSLQSYRWSRRLVDGTLMSKQLFPTRGIGPGSAFATFELAALMVVEMRELQINHPTACLSLHVDDFTPQIKAATPRDLADATIALCNDAVERFEQNLGMPFDKKKKAQLTTTSK